MVSRSRALVELHIATLLIGFNALFAKLISLPAILTTLGRSVIACVTLLFFISISKKKLSLEHRKQYVQMILFGVFLSIHWVTFYYSAQVSTVAIAVISLFTFPVITTFLEPVLIQGKLKVHDVISAIIVLLGVGLIVPELNLANDITWGILLGLTSAVAYSLRNILTKKYFSAYPSSTILCYQVGVVALSLMPFLLFHKLEFVGRDLFYLFALGIVFTALAHTLFVGSLSKMKAKTASIIASLQPIYGIIFAILILGEIPEVRTILGGMLIISTVAFETYNHAR